jgi:hypothetical protein
VQDTRGKAARQEKMSVNLLNQYTFTYLILEIPPVSSYTEFDD